MILRWSLLGSLEVWALALFPALLSAGGGPATAVSSRPASPWSIDFRYAPPWWQTAICLPDDWQKTLVGKEGQLLYDYPGKNSGFKTAIAIGLEGPTAWQRQELVSPRVPIVRTLLGQGPVEVREEAFALAPARTDCADPPRRDMLLARFRNTGAEPVKIVPTVSIDSELPVAIDAGRQQVVIGGGSHVLSTRLPFEASLPSKGRSLLRFAPITLAGGAEQRLAVGVVQGREGRALPPDAALVEHAQGARDEAEKYWEHLDLPYGVFEVPDAGVQALLDSSVRNIYQAREIKKGLPAFQVGPTCYRGLWVVDGSFLMESIAYLGRQREARSGIQYLLSFQRDDGSFMLIDGHWKETGIALWAVTRHARLTGDPAWLGQLWPKIQRGMAAIENMRASAASSSAEPNYRLIPAGFSDGGLAGRYPEYTNVYWTLVGMKAAVDAARWLGKADDARRWQAEYDDFYATFRKAAERDAKTDAQGNRYVPIRMRDDQNAAPQKAQWAFLHAVFPGKVFAPGDRLVEGNLAMLRANECEGLVYGTGWINAGVWNYFGSFYAHAWLWTGRGQKAAETLYQFGNHASPLLVWREEQSPQGHGRELCGDMPHNWASAEFIRLVRHLLVLERGEELHLFEGLPAAWIRPGAVTRVRGALTEFGPISLELRVSADGRAASLHLDPPRRDPARKIVLHLDGWSGRSGTLDLPAGETSDRQIPLGKP
jgi:hypothetical protein